MLVLDTDALSAVMHRIPSATARLAAQRPDEVLLVAPVAAEIHFGLERLARGSRRRQLLEREYQRLRALLRFEEWTEEAALEFGKQKARLEKLGTPLEDFDIAVAASAIALGARLATSNVKHMARITGLTIEAWE